jgi:hypothetical protein
VPCDATTGDSLAAAVAAHALVDVDPRQASEAAEAALGLARSRGQPEGQVAALHARGYAFLALGDRRAVASLRAAIRVAEQNGLETRAALARCPLAGAPVERGAIPAALREIEAAAATLDGVEHARSEVFRIGIMNLAGQSTGDIESSDEAVLTLRASRDYLWEARLLRNRGNWLRMRGDTDAAELELSRARDLFVRVGAHETARVVEIQLAIVALLQGSLPECLARLDAIDPGSLTPRSQAELELLRAKALASGRLMTEALQSLDAAQALWDRAGVQDHEGRIDAIELTLLAGDATGALALARATQRSFASQGRPVLAARTAGLALAAQIASNSLTVGSVRAGRRAAAVLARAGWSVEACRIQIATARAAVELGQPRTAAVELAACQQRLRQVPNADRIEALHVQALIRLAEGDTAAARRAVRRGLSLLERHRAALGAADLRATSSAIGSELATLGLRIALTGRRAWPTLVWAEALRASALQLTPVTPPDNPELRVALTELRQVAAEIERAQHAGRSARSLVATQAHIETRVRRLSRHVSGAQQASRLRLSRQELVALLAERALVEYVTCDGELFAVTLVGGRLRRHSLGSLSVVAEQVQWLRFAVQRLAHLRRGAPQRAALLAGGEASAGELERALISPLREVIGERELVIVPTGPLHGVPWGTLPALRTRPLTVTPAATLWSAGIGKDHCGRARRSVLVAGPRLAQARRELDAVARLRPSARVLAGAEATVRATMRAIDGAAVAHIICHGTLRADSPLFTSLELADGPLHAYDLQRLRRPPELVVLSACDVGSAQTHPGDELLGFASMLLALGTRNVIASVVAVPDAGATRLMRALHRALVTGQRPAPALASARGALLASELPLTGFLSLGAG